MSISTITVCGERVSEHTVRHEGGWQAVYWSGNTAATKAGADRVTLSQFLKGYGYYTVIDFKLPDHAYEFERIWGALDRAYESGKKARSREFCELLGAECA